MLKCNEKGEPVGDWKKLPSMINKRYYFDAAIIDDNIYAVGGLFDVRKSSEVEVFDAKLKLWKQCSSMSQARCAHAIATYNKEIYVFGDDGVCEKYNPVTDTWTPIAGYTKGASYRGAAVVGDQIYLVGGKGCKEMDIYDPKTNTCSKGPQLPYGIGSCKCVAISDEF